MTSRVSCVDRCEITHVVLTTARAVREIKNRNADALEAPRPFPMSKVTPATALLASRRGARRCRRTQEYTYVLLRELRYLLSSPPRSQGMGHVGEKGVS